MIVFCFLFLEYLKIKVIVFVKRENLQKRMVEAYRHDKARVSLVIIAITLYAIVIVLNQLSARGSNSFCFILNSLYAKIKHSFTI